MASRNKRAGFGGLGRQSTSKGADDPRTRRSSSALVNESLLIESPLTFNPQTRRLTLKAGARVQDLPAGASQADQVDKINEILSSLRAAGLLET